MKHKQTQKSLEDSLYTLSMIPKVKTKNGWDLWKQLSEGGLRRVIFSPTNKTKEFSFIL